ncbi:MAG: TetR/AcrR family transcriptional regulator [Clostridium sp.]|uniref:TetR/AcrR family transcriptional regulator n=1 Tax=Clostridium sp. TaxID=1506 RepID=UPI003EE4C5E8
MQSVTISNMTKELFSNALKNRMKTKAINKITIQELSEECGLNRRTFYRHFKDIYDLLVWSYQTEIENKIEPYIDFNHWEKGLLELFEYFYSNKETSFSIIKYSRREYLEKFLNALLLESIEPIMKQEPHYVNLSYEKQNFLIKFYSLSFTTLLINWIEEGMTEPPEEIIHYVKNILDGSILRIKN